MKTKKSKNKILCMLVLMMNGAIQLQSQSLTFSKEISSTDQEYYTAVIENLINDGVIYWNEKTQKFEVKNSLTSLLKKEKLILESQTSERSECVDVCRQPKPY